MTTLFISHSSKDKRWAEQVREALHGQGYQWLFLDSHPDDGIHAGAKWEQTLWQRLRQARGIVVLCSRHWLASPWCVAEAMMARERGKPVFLLATKDVIDGRQARGDNDSAETPQIPDFLKDTQFISLSGVTEEDAYRRLWRGLEEEGLKDDFPLPDRPYPGLEPFQETDAAVFFGRDDEIVRVRGVLNRRRRNNAKGFVLVLGASGCGKSSLVRAGVLPRLRRARGEDGAAGAWVIPPPFASGKGLEGLAGSLALAFQEANQPLDLGAIRQRLQPTGEADDESEHGVRSLRALAGELLVARGVAEGHVLLVLDQLEEVFGTAQGSDQGTDARSMLRLLLAASADDANPVVVLATMRSDFLNAFQLFPGAAERYEEVTLDPMPRPRFGELIEGPAEGFGLTLGAGLTERLVEDTRYDDALPLLAFTLERLYAKGGGDGVLTLEEYRELFPAVKVRNEDGTTTEYRGVSAAIKHAADEILSDTGYAGLPADDPQLRDLRRAFYRLAQVGEAGQFTRRTALWSQMPDSCQEVLQRFVDQRLLVSGAEHGEPTLSVAHEALFRVWDTLNNWLLQDRKALTLRGQIEEAAAGWDAEKQTEMRDELLWSEARILDAMGKIRLSGVSLDDVARPEIVRAFLGPTDPDEIAKLPSLSAAEDAACGSGRYGDAWRLSLGHVARASVGVRLSLLGDRRRGVGLRGDGLPDIDWCRIEGGEVAIEIRSDPNNPNSDVADTLTRNVEPFWIARYPVTIAQFQAFLKDCHQEGKWRLPPDFPGDFPPDYPPPKHRARHSNHPADTVNWYDALAFCHWLSTRLSIEARLPTEFEWQLAASGGDSARTYPWGPDWDPQTEPWRANTVESALGSSTAVGLYPLGASPAGVLDMAGTLSEWCLNAFEDPEDTGFSGSAHGRRVLRGGSLDLDQGFARSANRSGGYPIIRISDVGFRVLCSSPIVDH